MGTPIKTVVLNIAQDIRRDERIYRLTVKIGDEVLSAEERVYDSGQRQSMPKDHIVRQLTREIGAFIEGEIEAALKGAV